MKDALINSKIYDTLGVVYLSEIKNWNLVKGESKRSQAVFVDSENHTKSSHFGFVFITKSVSDLFNFTITMLDGRVVTTKAETDNQIKSKDFKKTNQVLENFEKEYQKLYLEHETLKKSLANKRNNFTNVKIILKIELHLT